MKKQDGLEAALYAADSSMVSSAFIFPGLKNNIYRPAIKAVEQNGLSSGAFFKHGTPAEMYFTFKNKQLGNAAWMVRYRFFNDSLFCFSLTCYESLLARSDASVYSTADLFKIMLDAYDSTYGASWMSTEDKRIWVEDDMVVVLENHSDEKYPFVSISHINAHRERWINKHLTAVKFGADVLTDTYSAAYYPERIVERDSSLIIE